MMYTRDVQKKEDLIWSRRGAREPAVPSDSFYCMVQVFAKVWSKITPLLRLSCSYSFSAYQNRTGTVQWRRSKNNGVVPTQNLNPGFGGPHATQSETKTACHALAGRTLATPGVHIDV